MGFLSEHDTIHLLLAVELLLWIMPGIDEYRRVY